MDQHERATHPERHNMLNFFAIVIYAVVCAVSFVAWSMAARRGAKANARTFAFATFAFALLTVSRALGAEDMLHDAIKRSFMLAGEYSERRAFQKPLVIAGLLAMFAFAFYKGFRIVQVSTRFSPAAAVSLACWTMSALVFVRTLSWHTTDKMLFGPVHLNWFVDMGCTLITGVGAALYAWRPRRAGHQHRAAP